jgi:hypothetical protein
MSRVEIEVRTYGYRKQLQCRVGGADITGSFAADAQSLLLHIDQRQFSAANAVALRLLLRQRGVPTKNSVSK